MIMDKKDTLSVNSDKGDEDKRQSLKKTLRELADSSSLHGIPKIMSSKQLAIKILWCLLFLGTLAVCLMQITDLFRTFYSYPVQTTVNLEFSPIAFPAVSVCNMNPVRKSKITETHRFDEILKHTQSRRKREARPMEEPAAEKSVTFHSTVSEQAANTKDPPGEQGKQHQENSRSVRSVKTDIDLRFHPTNSYPGDRRQQEGKNKNLGASESFSNNKQLRHKRAVSDLPQSSSDLQSSMDLSIGGLDTSLLTDSLGHSSWDIPSPIAVSSSILQNQSAFVSSDNMSQSITLTNILTNSLPWSGAVVDTSAISQTVSDIVSVSSSFFGPSEVETSYDYYGSDNYYGSSDYGSWESWGSYYGSSDYFYWDQWWESYSSYYYNDYSYYYWDSWSSWYDQSDLFYASQHRSRKDEWFQKMEAFQTTFKDAPVEEREDLGHQKEDMIHSVTFMGNVEAVKHMHTFTTTQYGNCFTLSNRKYVAWRSGPNYGISMTLNLQREEYVSNFTTGYGIRIVFHDPGTYPLPFQEGITLSPGTETNIGLRKVEITRMSEPYGSCIDGVEFQKRYKRKYSMTACNEFCRIDKIVSVCECLPVDAPDRLDFNTSVLSVCNSTNKVHKDCMLDVDNKFNTGIYTCGCKGPCKETVFQKTLSSRQWPSPDYLVVLLEEACKKNMTFSDGICDYLDDAYSVELHEKDFLSVIIYFEDLNFETISETPMYESVRFLSDIGGAMGLFLGASVLSVVEILQLFLEIGLYLRRRVMTAQTTAPAHTSGISQGDKFDTALARKPSVYDVTLPNSVP